MSSTYSGGEVFLPNNHKMREAGIPDSSKDGRRYCDFLAAGYNDPKMGIRFGCSSFVNL